MTQVISVNLPIDIVYVSGNVNGTDYTFTLSDTDGIVSVWAAEVARATPDIYQCVITAVSSGGSSTTYTTTLYYGLNLVTDRSGTDVAVLKELIRKSMNDWTTEELSQFLSGMKGAYNASDLNRVETAVAYLVGRFAELGFIINFNVKNTWNNSEFFTEDDASRYLSNIAYLRNLILLPEGTPFVPVSMDRFTYNEANALEQILETIDELITNTIKAFCFSGELYTGEV